MSEEIMTSQNFEFLREGYPELAELGGFAEKYLHDDPASAVSRQRASSPLFLWGTLMVDQTVRNQAKMSGGGAIMEGWNLGIIKSLMVRVPPIELQMQFRQVIEQIKRGKVTGFKTAGLESDLFNSLVQRAFRGEF